MKTDKYTTIVIESQTKNIKNNTLYVLKTKLYPGKVYKIRSLLLLCTCYEIDEYYNPIIYLCILLENDIKRELDLRNMFPPSLELINHNLNEINYKLIANMFINKSN